MPNDYMTLKALAEELTASLSGGHISKINMPADDEAILDIYCRGETRTLILCARKPVARIHLTTKKRGFSNTPPAFCMLLRKHLTGGGIAGVTLLYNDRIAAVDILSKNELHDLTRYRLIVEIGGSPNLILTDENGGIYDCTRRSALDSARPLMPGLKYTPPEQNKSNLFCVPFPTLPERLTAAEILRNYVGVSKETAAEIEFLCNAKPLPAIAEELFSLSGSPRFAPCIYVTDNKPNGFFAFPYITYNNGMFEAKRTLSEAVDAYYSGLADADSSRRATSGLRQTVKKLIAKTEKRLQDNKNRLAECAKKDILLQTGELIKCNAYAVAPGQTSMEVYDYYQDCTRSIPLDPALSPIRNAEIYYKKYAKLKGAEAYAKKEQIALTDSMNYLLNIWESLDNCTTDAELAEISAEISALNGVSKPSGKGAKKEKPSQPLRLDVGGFTVYLGKNNAQNDMVTFKLASSRDIWMHAKHCHGAHAVILTEGKEVPAPVLARVAAFTAYFSAARLSSSAEVDYTRRSNVRRLGKPGLVAYTDYKTIHVKPEEPKFIHPAQNMQRDCSGQPIPIFRPDASSS
jgi:predicted ribosome quality control (RQC) complex YloA/Tae2 family protein